MVVLFYRIPADEVPRYVGGQVWPREGQVDRIQGELLENGRVRLRVFLRDSSTGEEKEMIFEMDPRTAPKRIRTAPVRIFRANVAGNPVPNAGNTKTNS